MHSLIQFRCQSVSSQSGSVTSFLLSSADLAPFLVSVIVLYEFDAMRYLELNISYISAASTEVVSDHLGVLGFAL